MREKEARKKLKNWVSTISKKIKKQQNIEFKEYKAIIILIFSSILLEKLKNKESKIESFKEVKSCKAWYFIVSKYNNVFTDIENYSKEFECELIRDTVYFATEFIDENFLNLDNILAWLYQYFNSSEIESDFKDTQFFTELYMVKHLVCKSFDKMTLDELKCSKIIDPACGGGNFLVAVIQELHDRLKISKLEFIKVIENNIYGYDIDSMMSFICYINIISKLLELQVIESLDKDALRFKIYYDMNNKFGSLLKNSNKHVIFNVADNEREIYNNLFKKQFDLVITNPPFKGRRELNEEIREYIKVEYPEGRGDLCNTFILRSYDLIKENGKGAFVAQNGWMFLDSYTSMREVMFEKTDVFSIIDLGSNSFFDLAGEKTNVALVNFKMDSKQNDIVIYGLRDIEYDSKVKLLNENRIKEYEHRLKLDRVKENISYRLDYLNKGNLNKAFQIFKPYSEYGKPMQGTSTGDNKKFVAYHWEVSSNEWKLVSKGGGYSKWSGLNFYKVHWGENGEVVKANSNSVVRNVRFFEDTELVYSDTGTSGLNVRLLRDDQIFIASGPGILVKKKNKYNHLAFLNSRIASYFIKTLTPKLTISAKYIGQLPVPGKILESEKIRELAIQAVKYKNEFNQKRPINYEFRHDDYFKYDCLYEFAQNDFLHDLDMEIKRLKCEFEINKIIEGCYNFNSDEMNIVYSTVGKSPYMIDSNEINIKIDELDNEISKILDNNCMVKRSRISKNSLGVEGILEYLALNNGYSPEKSIAFIEKNVQSFRKTLLKYYKHLLHRIELMNIEFGNESYKSKKNLEDYISTEIKAHSLKLQLDKWKTEELRKWHYNAFLKRPLKEIWSD